MKGIFIEYILQDADLSRIKDLFIEVLRGQKQNSLELTEKTGVEAKELLTPKDVCEFLSISLSTLNRYRRNKVLTPYQIGSRVYYKRTDIINSLVELTN